VPEITGEGLAAAILDLLSKSMAYFDCVRVKPEESRWASIPRKKMKIPKVFDIKLRS
jgi:hypothetical protein